MRGSDCTVIENWCIFCLHAFMNTCYLFDPFLVCLADAITFVSVFSYVIEQTLFVFIRRVSYLRTERPMYVIHIFS